MTRKEEREQAANNYVKGADKLHGYKYGIEDVKCGYLEGWADADKTMLDRVCKWLKDNASIYQSASGFYLANDLRKAMEDGKK